MGTSIGGSERLVDLADEFDLTTPAALVICEYLGIKAEDGGTTLEAGSAARFRQIAAGVPAEPEPEPEPPATPSLRYLQLQPPEHEPTAPSGATPAIAEPDGAELRAPGARYADALTGFDRQAAAMLEAAETKITTGLLLIVVGLIITLLIFLVAPGAYLIVGFGPVIAGLGYITHGVKAKQELRKL